MYDINSKRAQSSLEFLTILGIGLGILAILGAIFLGVAIDTKNSFDKKQLEKLGRNIITSVDKIYHLGEGNRITMTQTFPTNIINMTILHSEGSDNGNPVWFDMLVISYADQEDGDLQNMYFETIKPYVRFNCSSSCTHNTMTPGPQVEYNSTYNYTFLTGGVRYIQIESKGNYVNIDFVYKE